MYSLVHATALTTSNPVFFNSFYTNFENKFEIYNLLQNQHMCSVKYWASLSLFGCIQFVAFNISIYCWNFLQYFKIYPVHGFFVQRVYKIKLQVINICCTSCDKWWNKSLIDINCRTFCGILFGRHWLVRDTIGCRFVGYEEITLPALRRNGTSGNGCVEIERALLVIFINGRFINGNFAIVVAASRTLVQCLLCTHSFSNYVIIGDNLQRRFVNRCSMLW